MTVVRSETTPAYVTTEQATVIESVVINGDLAKLSPEQRVAYYKQVCDSLGLNPLTNPFGYIVLNGRLTLYAKKDATDQLRKNREVSVGKPAIEYADELVIVSVSATDKTGRTDSDIGVVNIGNLKGTDRANAMMKAVTKAKRRVTLSICGLGWLDETEVDSIPDAKPFDPAVMELKPREEIQQHWIDDAKNRRAFFGKLSEYGMGENEVIASGVPHIHGWTGTASELITHVREWAAAQQKTPQEVAA